MSVPAAPARARNAAWSIVPLALAQLIIALDYNIVYVAIPEMGRQLGFASHNLQWIVSAYAVVFGGFQLLGGRAADLFGRRRMFLLALTIYGVSSLIGGFAGNPTIVIVVRAVQGLGGALLFPTTLSLINTIFAEGKARNRALVIWSGAGASGLILGSLLGGLLTATLGWSSVFFVNVPIAAAVSIAALFVVPADKDRDRTRGFDLWGALTGTAGIALLVYVLIQGPVSGWGSPTIVASAVLAVVLIVVFLIIERRGVDPIMPLRLFRNRSLATAMVITFAYMATFGTLSYFLTVLFQTVYGYSALLTGMAFLVPAVAILIGSTAGDRVSTKTTTKVALLIGFLVGGAGTVLIAIAVAANGGYWALVPGLVVMGLGEGIAWTSMWIVAASEVGPTEQGVANGMASTTLQIGGAVGLAILVAIANAGQHGLTGERLRVAMAIGIRTAVYINGMVILVSALLALVLPNKPKAPAGRSTAAATVGAGAEPESAHS